MTTRLFPCPICPLRFDAPGERDDHVRNVHCDLSVTDEERSQALGLARGAFARLWHVHVDDLPAIEPGECEQCSLPGGRWRYGTFDLCFGCVQSRRTAA